MGEEGGMGTKEVQVRVLGQVEKQFWLKPTCSSVRGHTLTHTGDVDRLI